MVWYKCWTWYRSRIEEHNSRKNQQFTLEAKANKTNSSGGSVQRPNGEFAGRHSVGSRNAGSYTNDEMLGSGSAPSSSFNDDVNSAEASGINTGYYSY